jgi:tetratricopeptide (TPR) repeat protein
VLGLRPEHVTARLKLAKLLLGRSDFAGAEDHLRAALRIKPDARDAVEKLGDALMGLGKAEAAEAQYRKGLELAPNSIAIRINLGNVLKALDRPDEAAACYRGALQLAPNSVAARINLAAVLQSLGCLPEAAGECHAALALQPDHPAAHLNFGNILQDQGELGEAEAHFREALRVQPVFPEAHNNLGNLLRLHGRLDEAEAACRTALEQRPGYASAHLGLGNALKEAGRLQEAERSYREALRLNPKDPAGHNNLGAVLIELKRYDEAEATYREALRLKPGFVDAHCNLGAVLVQLGRTEDAEAEYREALRLKPDYVEAHNNLGVLLHDLGRLDEAEGATRAALRLKPDYAEAHVNLALTQLTMGRLAEAWPKYEWRWRMKKQAKHDRGFAQPLWAGEEIGERVLLLHAEQGFGDTLQFCRYAPLVSAGRRVILEAQRELVSLLARLPGVERIVARGEALPAFDLHCPLLSLPLALGTTLETMPSAMPYLAADPARVARWRERVDRLRGLKVGLVWAGNAAMAADGRRSIPLDRFAALAMLDGVRFVSLQKGPAAQQPRPAGMTLFDWTEEIQDFADTAALVETLDLVISIDSAVAHLAGALGKPVWLLNRFDACWRWLRSRDDSPWYPSLRQFRQPEPGDWDAPLRNVYAALEEQVERSEMASSLFQPHESMPPGEVGLLCPVADSPFV